jgi:hypothetical protein
MSLLNTIYNILAAIIQRRIASKLAPSYNQHNTDSEKYSHTDNTLLVLLDWETHSITCSHESLLITLEIMNIPQQIINIIAEMPNKILLYVEMDGQT